MMRNRQLFSRVGIGVAIGIKSRLVKVRGGSAQATQPHAGLHTINVQVKIPVSQTNNAARLACFATKWLFAR
jgi:hypothetical protein